MSGAQFPAFLHFIDLKIIHVKFKYSELYDILIRITGLLAWKIISMLYSPTLIV